MTPNKNSNKCVAFIVGLVASTVTAGLAQNDYMGRTPIPPAPEATALAKYGDIPVGYYTGIPEINLPLTEVGEGKLQIPIGLSYHSGGHKVDEIAPWTGLGWTLNSGGVVTRVVRGLPDEINDTWDSYSSTPESEVFDGRIIPPDKKFMYLNAANDGCIDLERDYYFFNFNGFSGKFIVDWNGNLIVSSEKAIKIFPFSQPHDNGTPGTSWLIVDDQGVQYEFKEIEETHQVNILSTWIPKCHKNSDKFESSWYLTKITDVNNENEIRFSYEGFNLEYPIVASEAREYLIGGIPSPGTSYNSPQSLLRIAAKRLKQITTSRNKMVVDFTPGTTARTDIKNANGVNDNVRALEKITVSYDGKTEVVFDLVYSYSTGRLTLKELIELRDGKRVAPPYRFEYAGGMPAYNSKSQDHWGFNNGVSNTTLIPLRDLNPLDPDLEAKLLFQPTGSLGANRLPNFQGSSSGVLTAINYPTGGKTEFKYELNEYSFIQGANLESFNIYEKEKKVKYAHHSAEKTEETQQNFTTVGLTLNSDGWVKIRMFGDAGTSAATQNTRPVVTLFNSAGESIISQPFGSNETGNNYLEVTRYKNLPAGSYTLHSKIPLSNPGENPYAQIEVEYFDIGTTKVQKKPAGGVRIKETRDFPGDGSTIVKRFSYGLHDDPAKSSGVIYNEPVYQYPFTKIFGGSGNTNGSTEREYESQLIIRVAQNRSILGDTQGSHIGYSEVTVENGNGENINGSTLYKFTSPREYSDGIIEEFPFRPPTNAQSHKTGMLKERLEFSGVGDQQVPVRKLTNTYEFKTYNLLNTKIAYKGGEVKSPQFIDKFLVGNYTMSIGLGKLIDSKEEMIYTAKSFIKHTEYKFDARLQNLKVQTDHLSPGEDVLTEYYYPQDFEFPDNTISRMKTVNMSGMVLETIKKRKKGNDEFVLGGSYSQYRYTTDDNGDAKLRMLKEYSLNLYAPLKIEDFNLAKNNPNGAPDENYTSEIEFNFFDPQSNPTQLSLRNGTKKSYVWDYFNDYPIAEVTNASIADVAFTSFEGDGKGQWTFAPSAINSTAAFTGKKSYSLGSGDVVKDGIKTTQEYIVSYWCYGAAPLVSGETKHRIGSNINGWTYHEHVIDNVSKVTLNGTSTIDELRLFPVGAQMTTFTFDPTIGRTSATDPNGRTTFYDYELNRLKQLRDTERNIVSKYDYQFKKK
jgi:hypothetical protein